jgi:hypothetical protein
MPAASVETQAMVQGTANATLDPRRVVTLLDPSHVEVLLCKYNFISIRNHIIMGLHEGFNIGI